MNAGQSRAPDRSRARGRGLYCTAVLLYGWVPALAQPPADAPAPGEPPGTALDTVDVEAREPRYVAPTSRDRIGRIWAPVLIDGRGPYRLVLDTGAGRSALVPRVAQALGKPQHPDKRVRLRGVTGEAIVGTVHVDTLTVGDLALNTLDLPVVADVFGGADGVLGAEGFNDLRIVIEFRRDHIEIRHSRAEPAPGGWSVLPLLPLPGRGLAVAALVGSVPTLAIIDTGAQVTVGNLALHERLRRRLAAAQVGHTGVVGATQDVQDGDSVEVPPIRLGSTESRGVHVAFMDLAIFQHWNYLQQPTILIGMDVLGVLDSLIIDYRRRELQLRGTQLGFLSQP